MQIKDIFSQQSINHLHAVNESQIHEHMHFDDRLDELMTICHQLMTHKGVYHLSIHFASSQLACWTYDNPYTFQIYNVEDIFSNHFMRLFSPLDSRLHTCIKRDDISALLEKIKSLRQSRTGSELRNASIHLINGYISLSFACDDTRYIPFHDFMAHSNTLVHYAIA